MTQERRQVLTTIGIATLVSAILVGLAWVSMADLVLCILSASLGLAIGWRLGYRHGVAQAAQTRRPRPRSSPGRGLAKRKAK